MTSDNPVKLMERALKLAERGRGKVEPNPLVGAVLVKENRIIAEGYHRFFGGPHAEIDALSKLADPSLAVDATMFVSLEPCCAFEEKKTPSCAETLVSAKIAKLFVATEDPFPKVSGRGIKILRDAGIDVEVGLLREKARYQNAPYFKLIKTGFPFVTVKWAMSLDGKIATKIGDSRWISNEDARRYAHKLRGLSDAIVVGVGTVLADDPLLTPRYSKPRRMPLRIVVDSKGQIPLSSKIVRTAEKYPTLIATTDRCDEKRLSALRESGCDVKIFNSSDGRVNLKSLFRYLGRQRITNVLVEGGGTLIASLFEERLVDRVFAFIAPIIIGGEKAKTSVEGQGVSLIKKALKGRFQSIRRFGDDFLIQFDFQMDYLL